MNPTKVINLLKEKKGMEERHPKFVHFVGSLLRTGLQEDDELVVAVVHKDGTVEKSKMIVKAEDILILRSLGSVFK